MFTTPCFIRKNTPELRKKLEELGYESYGRISDNENLVIATDGRTYIVTHEELFPNLGDYKKFGGRVYCGTNEDLFLAIAALRDDSDENQWFTDGYNWKIKNQSSNWERDDFSFFLASEKASIEELIEYFKNK